MNEEVQEYAIIPGQRLCQHCKHWEFFGPLNGPQEERAWVRRHLKDHPWWVHDECLKSWYPGGGAFTFARTPGFKVFCRPGAVKM